MDATATHRKAQLVLRAGVIRDMQRLWPTLDWSNLDATFPLWASVMSTLIERNRATSAQLAAAFYRSLRFSQGIVDEPPVVLAPPIERPRILTVLTVTALASAKASAAQGIARGPAMANAFVRSSGAVSRLVLEGGRETIRTSALADPRAEGWRRVTGGLACEFCTRLASRGAVYSESGADFHAHDHCGCQAAPVFR